MILTTSMLMERLNKYSDPAGKILRMKNDGKIFQLTRGIYETDKNVQGYCLAGAIFGPSYLSFDYALSSYGLIPEAVYAYTSATFSKKKAKEYDNLFGHFTYRDVPSDVYPFGIVIKEENGYVYQIATPEKALCDKLYTMPPVTSQKDIEKMLFDDLRIDTAEFSKLIVDDIMQIGDKYHCNNLKYLMKYLRRN
ncbi:hypothetical protein [Ruminococcus sp.]|uniref:type IV toxin-antitoxin system AbiEi family antitoxin domain-containing protein n=2 Tax=Ruminococcus sp. TaxID=41978 RepID=UPI0025E33AF9|nr:hypothetical protein [Ruminococcus sp.]MCR4794007.1 hypothetical protein [Ruminococcus sp.]